MLGEMIGIDWLSRRLIRKAGIHRLIGKKMANRPLVSRKVRIFCKYQFGRQPTKLMSCYLCPRTCHQFFASGAQFQRTIRLADSEPHALSPGRDVDSAW